ncbi:unnamed protein product [Heligmosomoides polygyrus]|uniref:Uncharacterized protein n=1 Tax=Heligmosomoides polygyrus TaxID=6339 RepID=A0A183G0K4_HELPZ|nr:unnamed protein product [Heligmosomoides polygyrus]
MVEEERLEVVLLKEERLRIRRRMEEELGCRSAPLMGCWVVLVELVEPPAVVVVVGEELEGLKEVTVAGILLMVELEQLGDSQAEVQELKLGEPQAVMVEEEQEGLRVEMEELERCKPEVAEAAGILLKMELVGLEEPEGSKAEIAAGILLVVVKAELEEPLAVVAVVGEELEDLKVEMTVGILLMVELVELEGSKAEMVAGILLMVELVELEGSKAEMAAGILLMVVKAELEEPLAVVAVVGEELEDLKEETTAGILLMVELEEPPAVVELEEFPPVMEAVELEELPAVVAVVGEELEGSKAERTAGILLMVEMVELEVASEVVEPQEQLVVRNWVERRGIL